MMVTRLGEAMCDVREGGISLTFSSVQISAVI